MNASLVGQIRMLPGGVAVLAAAEGDRFATTFEHSWPWHPWVTVFAFLLAAAMILAIYFREHGEVGRTGRWLLAAIRISLIAIVLFMLYGWTRQQHRLELPDLVVMIDDSESMALRDQDEPDGAAARHSAEGAEGEKPSRFEVAKGLLLSDANGWLDRLAADYCVKLYLLGASTRLQPGGAEPWKQALQAARPTGTASKLGQGLQDVLNAQRGRPTAAIVLLTDGITNAGETIGDVAENARRRGIPLFLVGMGRDQPTRDVWLSDLLVDEVVFVDEMVNFDVQLHAQGYTRETALVRLRRPDREGTLAAQEVAIREATGSQTVRLAYRPGEVGECEHVIEVVPLDGEATAENNRLQRRVTVRDATLRVLFVQSYPSYEFRFLKDLLSRTVRKAGEGMSSESVKAVELSTVLQQADLEHAQQDPTARAAFPIQREELWAYDVLVFGDVDPSFLSRSVMEMICSFVTERGGGMVVIAGPSFTPLAYGNTPLAQLLPIDLATAAAPRSDEPIDEPYVLQPTPLGLSSSPLQIGDTPAETARIWGQLPGLYWLLSAPDVRPAARVLAVHPTRKGQQGELLPAVLLQFVGSGKVIFHATDETYRWTAYPGDPKHYARYWLQTLRYLSRSKLSSSQASVDVSVDRSQYHHGETVRLRVQFGDERSAPSEDHGVVVVVQHGGGRRHQVILHRDGTRRGVFAGNITGLPVGSYRAWLASQGAQGASCSFTVAAPPGELARVAMDSKDLMQAAKTSGGRFYAGDKAQRLLHDLPPGQRTTIESLPQQPIWNSSFIVGLFVLLITAEWLMRKRRGMI